MRLFTCVIILVFAVVALCGVGESAAVATPILLTHIAIVTLLIVWGFVYGIQDGFSIFYHNTQTEYPTIINSSGHTLAHRSGIGAMYFGYCSGLLGITGFESAANFVYVLGCALVFGRDEVEQGLCRDGQLDVVRYDLSCLWDSVRAVHQNVLTNVLMLFRGLVGFYNPMISFV
eukprot:gene24545-30389_t